MVKRLHQKTVQTFSSRNPAVTMLFCFVFLLLLGWLDIITGDYSLVVFYLIPVSLAAWFLGKWSRYLPFGTGYS